MATKRKGFHPGGRKGKLHRELGIPEGERIPKSRLRSAARSSNREVADDAKRAETMEKWRHVGRKGRKSTRSHRRSRR